MDTLNSTLDIAIATLSAHGWFADRSPNVRAALAGIACLRDFETGQPVYHFGDNPDGMYGLVEGAFDIRIPRDDGLELTAHRADPGFWTGDLALFADQKRLISVYAAGPTRTLYLPAPGLRQLVTADPHLFADFYALTHENMATALRLLANLATTPSEVRVALRLLHYEESQNRPNEDLMLSHAKLAELVALSEPTLQRILSRLQADGMVELGYGRIRILDRKRLLELSVEGRNL